MESPPSVTRPARDAFHYPTLGGAALGFVAFVLVAALVGAAMRPFGADRDTVGGDFLASVPGELLGVAVALAAAAWPLRRLARQLTIPAGALPPIVLLYAGGMLVDLGALALDPYEEAMPEFDQLMDALLHPHDPVAITLVFFMLVVVAPVVEELLVRGILLRALAINWGPAVAVVVSAVTFAVLHLNLGQIRYAWIPGLVFAIVVLRTGALGMSMVLHALINLTVFAVLLAAGLAAVDPDAAAPAAPPPVFALAAVLTGVALLALGVRRLRPDVPRLAFLWGVPAMGAVSVRELCRRLRAVRGSGAVRCGACGERMRDGGERCWFCGALLADPAARGVDGPPDAA